MSTAVEITPTAVAFFSTTDLDIAKSALVDACKATKTVRRREGDGPIQYVEEPDHAMRVLAATKVIEFGRGKATATHIVANLTKPGSQADGGDLMRLIASDPEALNAIEDTLGKLKIAARNVQKGKPIEIRVTPALPEDPKPSS